MAIVNLYHVFRIDEQVIILMTINNSFEKSCEIENEIGNLILIKVWHLEKRK